MQPHSAVSGHFKQASRAFFVFLLLFLIAQIICLEVSDLSDDGKLLVKFKRQWVRSASIIKAPDDKDLVFFLGHSKILSTIIPELFDRENAYSTYSYNLALPGLPLAPHYFMLKDYLEKNKPPQIHHPAVKYGDHG